MSDGARFDGEAIDAKEVSKPGASSSRVQLQLDPIIIPGEKSPTGLKTHPSEQDISIWNIKSMKSVEREAAAFE